MSNDKSEGNIYERLWKLWAMICKMIMDGVRDPQKVAELLQSIVDGVEGVKVFLRLLFTFRLGTTKGTDYEGAKKLFNGFFDPDFEKCGIVFDRLASETDVACDELIENGKFAEFLGDTALELEKRRLYGSQFVAICENHREKLRKQAYSNFFVLTRDDEPVAKDLSNAFVARVYVDDSGELDAHLFRISYDDVWHSDFGRRAFSRQQ